MDANAVDTAQVSDASRATTAMKDDGEEEEWVRARDSGTPCGPTCRKSEASPTVKVEMNGRRDASGVAPPRLQALCPLCFADTIVDPVLLHAPARAAPCGGKGDGAMTASTSRVCCVACRECARRWWALHGGTMSTALCAESQSPTCPCCGQSTLSEAVAPSQDDAPVAMQDLSDTELHDFNLVNVSTAEDGECSSALAMLVRRGAPEGGSDEVNNEATVCGACEQPCATQFCLQCDIALCSVCVQTTHARGLYRSTHSVVPLTEARPRRQRRCGLHPGQVLELYCATCHVCACVTCCFAGTHTGHRIVPLTEVAAETRREVQTLCAALHTQAEAAARQERELISLIPDYDATVSKVEESISGTFASLHDALRRREAQLMHDLREGSAAMRADMQGCVDTSALLSSALRDGCDRLATLLAHVDTVTLLRLKNNRLAAQVHQRRDVATAQLQALTRAASALRSRLGDGTLARFVATPTSSAEAGVDLVRQLDAVGVLQLAGGVAAALQQRADDTALEADDATQAPDCEGATRSCSGVARPVPSLALSEAVRLTEAHPVRPREGGGSDCLPRTTCNAASTTMWSRTTLTVKPPSWPTLAAIDKLADVPMTGHVDLRDNAEEGKQDGLLAAAPAPDDARFGAQQYKRPREDAAVAERGLGNWRDLTAGVDGAKRVGDTNASLRLQWQM